MKQNNNFIKTFILLYFFISSSLFGASIIKEFTFPINTLKSEIVNGYSFVSLKGCDLYLQDIGKPILPFANVNLLIPPDAEITEIEVLDIKQTDMPGEFLLYPGQPPRPISYQGPIEFIEPDIETYNLSTEYPGKLTEIVPSGNKSGFRIGGIFLYPLQYIPKEKKLILYERIRIRISYEQGRYEVWPLTQSQKELFSADVRSLVCNPEDINRFSPPTRASENPDVDYIILTSQTLEPRFGPLVKWLRKTGIWADTFNTSWVYANYTGYDNAEKIRKFILDYFTNHGTKYVLLAGDISIIPKRGTYSIVNTAPPTIDSFIPCDLYYFDLQWSWDGNGNHVYGDNWTISGKKDTVDLYYDVYGGRWPVETQAEIDTLMRKFFTYVKTPDTLYQKRILLPWGDLWGNDSASRQSQDTIANLSPTGWTDRYINKTMNTTEVRDSLNNGFGFCHLVGHGNEVGVYWTSTGPEMYLTSHTSQQINYNKLVIANSMGCYPGCFDYSSGDCLAEEMLKARGSAIATIMNSRYGWGYSSGQIGPSELLDVRFYDHLFSRDSIRIASCHQSSKERYRNSALNIQVWRWCYYELNLFGEPQMMMWKDNPKKMVAKFNSQIGTGSQSFAVTCSSQGTPLAGALVCLWKGTEVYTKGTTASNGQVSFAINPTTPGYMYVTVTAKNKIPFEDSCNVIYTKDVGVTTIEVP
ncbi:MAG: C25 family cysteine peptidase, partial [candidate division WOR-3 bacterium]